MSFNFFSWRNVFSAESEDNVIACQRHRVSFEYLNHREISFYAGRNRPGESDLPSNLLGNLLSFFCTFENGASRRPEIGTNETILSITVRCQKTLSNSK